MPWITSFAIRVTKSVWEYNSANAVLRYVRIALAKALTYLIRVFADDTIVKILFCKKYNMIGGNGKINDLIGGKISKHGSSVYLEKGYVHA